MSNSNYLGFDPRNLGVFQASKSADEQTLIYKALPENSISEDGIYRSQIRVLYNVFDMRNSIVEKQTYALRDTDGFFSVDSALSVNDRNCPIFKAWKKLRYSENESLKELGNRIFEKRFSRWCLIQVVEDPNKPELNGKFMFFKLPKVIWELMQAKMNPAPETKKLPVPVMDFMRGTLIYLNVKPGPDDPQHPERKKREISYSTSEISSEVYPVTREDGSSFLTEDEQSIVDKYIDMESAAAKKRKVEDREAALVALANDPITEEVSKLYVKVAEELKMICPNIGEELGFKYFDKANGKFWDDQLTARVNRFCERAISGQDPAQQSVVQVNDAFQQSVVPLQMPQQVNTIETETVTEEEDLPF